MTGTWRLFRRFCSAGHHASSKDSTQNRVSVGPSATMRFVYQYLMHRVDGASAV